MKRYVIIAGVNGAGKTSLYKSIVGYSDLEKVNADDIARQIGYWGDKKVQAEAGIITVKKIRTLLNEHKSFSQETTLTGKSIFNNIRKARELGYRIELHFVGVDSAQTAIERVKHRVNNGGHGVDDSDIIRRYKEGTENLKAIIQVCDEAWIYDNTDEFRTIAYYQNGKWQRIALNEPGWFVEWKG